MKIGITAVYLTLTLMLSPSVNAKEKERTPDYLALAALLVKGGDFEKAGEALSKADKSKKNIDLARYYTIEGLIKLRLQQYSNARDSYLQAKKNGQQDKAVLIYLAQAYYGLKNYRKTLASLSESYELWQENPRVWLLKSLALWSLKEYSRTLEVLISAAQHFPEEKQFSQRRVFLLIELGLYQAAVQAGVEILDKPNSAAIDYQTIGKAMLEAGQYAHALPILEKALLEYPENVKIIRSLSRVYAFNKQFFSAANLLERAASQDNSLYSEVAELYRKANKSEQALYFNQIVIDQNKKFKQRLAIYLDASRFDDAIGMKNTLYRVGLLKDVNIRYALAYAYFSLGKYQQAGQYLDGIRQADLFRKATQLRKAMLSCEQNPLRC